MRAKIPSVVECAELPATLDPSHIYRLMSQNVDDSYYFERTDRNIGWLTRNEQEMLRSCVVGVAGCGGMGGLIAATLVRLGVGEVRIADCEVFDVSNINRQFGASRRSVGVSKVAETARLIRDISNDVPLVVYPQGITSDTVDHFLDRCDLVCDEIEFFAIGARVLLHQQARAKKINLLNCDTVGHSTFCFKFTHDSMHLENVFGFGLDHAEYLEQTLRNATGATEEVRRARAQVMEVILRAFVPYAPEYGVPGGYSTAEQLNKRLYVEGKASIVATNPPMASGFMANRALAELVYARSPTKRNIQVLPPMPGYLAFDALTMQATIHKGVWW